MTTTAPRASARPDAPPKPRKPRVSAVTRAPWILLAPFLALFGLTFLLPILVAIGQSFTSVTRAGLFGEQGVSSQFAWFDNYRQALEDGNFIASIGRMFLFGAVQVPIMIVLCTILALLLESAAAKLPGLFRAAYFLPYGIPGVIATTSSARTMRRPLCGPIAVAASASSVSSSACSAATPSASRRAS